MYPRLLFFICVSSSIIPCGVFAEKTRKKKYDIILIFIEAKVSLCIGFETPWIYDNWKSMHRPFHVNRTCYIQKCKFTWPVLVSRSCEDGRFICEEIYLSNALSADSRIRSREVMLRWRHSWTPSNTPAR